MIQQTKPDCWRLHCQLEHCYGASPSNLHQITRLVFSLTGWIGYAVLFSQQRCPEKSSRSLKVRVRSLPSGSVGQTSKKWQLLPIPAQDGFTAIILGCARCKVWAWGYSNHYNHLGAEFGSGAMQPGTRAPQHKKMILLTRLQGESKKADCNGNNTMLSH